MNTNYARSVGFTILELMIAIAVVAVLAATSFPFMSQMVSRNRISAQSNELIGILKFTQSEAIRRNKPITFCRTDSESSTACAAGTSWEHWIVAVIPANGATTVIRRGKISGADDAITVSSTLDNAAIVYRPNGINNTVAGNNTITSCGHELTQENLKVLNISVTGRVDLATTTGGAC